eukprot:CAMPEP_0171091674 /NCGR_PEP_ID=MMETSP0766_2-20121228/34782_1 /TAXON_ID=439317 /ORGANISM="Gambierdiscus australes, Strain CAWD 149" /LENGTH=73 /DNA_ID=CAMNT_0011549821 /DNA_START=15 /DNA_END=233 /DNA_ORIENTATION=+
MALSGPLRGIPPEKDVPHAQTISSKAVRFRRCLRLMHVASKVLQRNLCQPNLQRCSLWYAGADSISKSHSPAP